MQETDEQSEGKGKKRKKRVKKKARDRREERAWRAQEDSWSASSERGRERSFAFIPWVSVYSVSSPDVSTELWLLFRFMANLLLVHRPTTSERSISPVRLP